jgi:hypothetical protein
MSAAPADRNLLFGILAVQIDFIGRYALVAAMHAWVLAKDRPLGDILAEQGALTPDTRPARVTATGKPPITGATTTSQIPFGSAAGPARPVPG